MQGFGAIAGEIRMNDAIMAFMTREACGVFCGNDHLITKTGVAVKPFANPAFGLLVLVVVGCIDEVAALGVEEV